MIATSASKQLKESPERIIRMQIITAATMIMTREKDTAKEVSLRMHIIFSELQQHEDSEVGANPVCAPKELVDVDEV